MALKRNIDRAAEWHRFEKKRFKSPITENGVPVNLTGLALEWILIPNWRSVYASVPTNKRFNRTAGQFQAPETPAGGAFPSIAVWDVSDSESGALLDGWFYYELWDRTSDSKLVYGGALLQPGRAVIV
jgi:hypothetical protein